MLDVPGHRIHAVELARRMHRRQHDGGHSLAAYEIKPGESDLPRRRHDAGNNCCVIEPGRGQFVNEGADVGHVGDIAIDVSGHRSLQTGRLTELRKNIEKFKARRPIATASPRTAACGQGAISQSSIE